MLKNDLINFGAYNLQVLDIKNGKALIITNDIIEIRWYHSKFTDTTWADCELRYYLNDTIYNQSRQGEKQ